MGKVFINVLFSYPSISKSKNHHSLFTFSLELLDAGHLFLLLWLHLLISESTICIMLMHIQVDRGTIEIESRSYLEELKVPCTTIIPCYSVQRRHKRVNSFIFIRRNIIAYMYIATNDIPWAGRNNKLVINLQSIYLQPRYSALSAAALLRGRAELMQHSGLFSPINLDQ